MRLGLVTIVVLSVACSKSGLDDPGGAGGTTGQAGATAGGGGTPAGDGGPGGQGAAGNDGGTAGVGGVAGAAYAGGKGGAAGFIPPGVGGRWLSAAQQTALASAATTWAAAKVSCGVYSYNRFRSSSFSGYYVDTYVEVMNDVPSRYHSLSGSSPPRGNPDAGVTEVDLRGDQITQPAALTVEGLLAECASVLTVDQNRTDVVLSISAQGVPTACLATPKNCADDCTSGISLRTFVCAPLGADGKTTSAQN